MTRKLLAPFVLFALSCGGSAPDSSPASAGGTAGGVSSAWEGLDLVATVRDGAIERIREVEPDLDVSAIDGWTADPSAAPALGDRVCEQLLHLAIAAAADGDARKGVRLIRLVRAKARNRNNAYAATTLLSELARRSAEGPEAQSAAIRQVLAELPRNRFGSATVVFQLFQNQGQIDARLERIRGQLVSLDTAASALYYEAILRPIVEHRAMFLSAIEAIRAEHEAQPPQEEYAFSTVDLSEADDARPIVVAVWDTGVADELFAERLFTADDGSHGVIADPTEGQTGYTYEPAPEVVEEYAPFLRGIMDLRAGLASTEAAQRVLELMGRAQSAEALEELSMRLDEIGEWGHGTHVAGIMLAGVPQARLAIFRSAWAAEARLYHNRGPTDEELAAERANVDAIAAFIEANDVRVVNASLGFGRDYVENELRHESDTYTTDAEVRARAEVVHAHRRATWSRIFERCPNTLFVVAAGNSNRDVVEYGDVPASLTHDNLLVVGAVDRYGDWATFTNSNPEVVTLFDWGVEVPSLIPNGQTVPLSGTSMASPNAANLATKILSVNPRLTPAEVISIMRETASPIAEPFYGGIAHEERAIARARELRRSEG